MGLVLQGVDRDHRELDLDLGRDLDVEAIALAIEDEAVMTDRIAVLEHREGVGAIVGPRERRRQRKQRRRKHRQKVLSVILPQSAAEI